MFLSKNAKKISLATFNISFIALVDVKLHNIIFVSSIYIARTVRKGLFFLFSFSHIFQIPDEEPSLKTFNSFVFLSGSDFNFLCVLISISAANTAW